MGEVSANIMQGLVFLAVIGCLFKSCSWDHEERMYRAAHPVGECTQHVEKGEK